MNSSHEELLDNEWFVVRHSGETPEIALYSAFHYLTEAEDGPRLRLSEEQTALLKKAAGERYREIVLRDLQPNNRSLPIYRGVKRSIVNYHRYKSFCRRQQVIGGNFENEVAANLLIFLAVEMVGVAKGDGKSSINCTFPELNHFARKIGLVKDELPAVLADLCCEPL